jgi:hypothetical protein
VPIIALSLPHSTLSRSTPNLLPLAFPAMHHDPTLQRHDLELCQPFACPHDHGRRVKGDREEAASSLPQAMPEDSPATPQTPGHATRAQALAYLAPLCYPRSARTGWTRTGVSSRPAPAPLLPSCRRPRHITRMSTLLPSCLTLDHTAYGRYRTPTATDTTTPPLPISIHTSLSCYPC